MNYQVSSVLSHDQLLKFSVFISHVYQAACMTFIVTFTLNDNYVATPVFILVLSFVLIFILIGI